MTSTRGTPPGCAYCGLPVAASAAGDATSHALFCCLGCRLAARILAERDDAGVPSSTLARLGLAAFFCMNVMVFTMVLWTQDVYTVEAVEGSREGAVLYELFRYASLLFAAPVLILLGGPLVESSLQTLRARRLSVDLFLLIGVVASFVYSIVSVVRGSGHVYFEVACMVLVAVTLGRWLEATGKYKTTAVLRSLQRLLPSAARQVHADGSWEQVPLESVAVSDQLLVLAGERIPADGMVLAGTAAVDEQVLTGESRARIKNVGDAVVGGTLNLDGELTLSVTTPPVDGTLKRLVDLVCQAAEVKSPEQKLADRLATYFTPAILVIAATTVIVHGGTSSWSTGWLAGLAVLLIACPCALAVATPLAIWAAVGRAAREHVLFRSAEALTRLARTQHFFFDKTGTLSEGRLSVRALVCEDATATAEILNRAAAMAQRSRHPTADAVASYAVAGGASAEAAHALSPVRTFPGQGLVATWQSHGPLALGNRRLMTELGLQIPAQLQTGIETWQPRGATFTFLGWEGRARGLFVLGEKLRSSTAPTLAWLIDHGYQVTVLTGDTRSRAAAALNVAGVDVCADLLPQDKLTCIRVARESGTTAAMVGDGINDAPALAMADLGIALGCGTDISHATADVCLLANDLTRLPWAVCLTRQTVRVIRQNLFWTVAYNSIGIGIAAAGWLSPIVAAVAMVGSSLFVITNTLRLTQFDEDSCPSPQSSVEPATAVMDHGTLKLPRTSNFEKAILARG